MQMFALIKVALYLFSEIFSMAAPSNLPFDTEHQGHFKFIEWSGIAGWFQYIVFTLVREDIT